MKKSGFTLIELLLVVAIIIIIGTIAAPIGSNLILKVSMQTTADIIVSSLHRAQSLSLDGSGDWGICHTGTLIRIYTGTCASPTKKEDSTIPNTLISVSGLSDTSFSRINGEPSNSLTITLSDSLATTTITLNPLGVVDVN